MIFPFDLQHIEDPDAWRTLCPSLSLTTEPMTYERPTSLTQVIGSSALGTSTSELAAHAFARSAQAPESSAFEPSPHEDTPISSEDTPISSEDTARHKAQLLHDGYFAQPALFSRDEVKHIASAVEQITTQTGAAVWALLYDDLWQMMYALQPCLTPILGEKFVLLPDIWVWNLRPNGQDHGWRPHRDRERGSVPTGGLPRLLTVWIALTDATPDNGCIYVLPASLDTRYHHYGRPNEEISIQFQDIRALPASAGTALGWSAQLLHWGGRTSIWTQTPRISVAFEFQSHDFSSGAPFVLPPIPPPFSQRLGLVARQLLQYRHFVHLPEPIERICQRLIQTHLPQKRRFSDVFAKLFSRSS